MFRFFRWVRDARHDPFFPCSWLVAACFVLTNLRWFARQERAGWPLPPA